MVMRRVALDDPGVISRNDAVHAADAPAHLQVGLHVTAAAASLPSAAR